MLSCFVGAAGGGRGGCGARAWPKGAAQVRWTRSDPSQSADAAAADVNGVAPGRAYLEHALPMLGQVLAGTDQLAFVPYAQTELDEHTNLVASAIAPLGIEVVGVHRARDPRAVVESAQAVFVGGGNAFRLLATLYRYSLVDAIQSAGGQGAPYIGSSAGTNLACPSLRTTNDMPIVEPPTFATLNFVPFQINPHYPATETMHGHLGETRDKRIAEFLEDNDVPVVGLEEGTWLHIVSDTVELGGVARARVFQRNAEPLDVTADTDLSFLFTTQPDFDHRPAGECLNGSSSPV